MSTLKTNNIQHVDRSDPSIIINTDGSVNVAGVLTYEDVTSVDSIGIVTARGLSIFGNTTGLNVTGISTFGGNVTVPGLTATSFVSVGDNDTINAGDGNDLKIYHQSSDNNSYIENDTGNLIIRADAANKDITLQAADILTFNTGGANERARIDSSGNLGISTDTASKKLDISTESSSDGIRIRSKGATYNDITISSDRTGGNQHLGRIVAQWDDTPVAYMAFNTGADTSNKDDGEIFFATSTGSGLTERLRIDSSGRLLIGTATTKSAGSGQYAKLNVEGYAGGNECFVSLSRAEAASAMSNNDEVANLTFNDSAGYEFARIQVLADAATGATDTPGRIVFRTTADGSSTSTERMRIDSLGHIHVKGTNKELRFYRDDNARYGAITYDGGQFNIKNPASDNTQVTKSDGTLHTRFNNGGNLELSNGNLVLSTSGKGIDFSNTSDSAGASAELLDDYEEGIWTPSYGSSSVPTSTYATTGGRYTRVGRLVTVTGRIQMSNSTTNTGALTMGGFPFACSNHNFPGGITFSYTDNWYGSGSGDSAQVTFLLVANTQYGYFYNGDGNTIGASSTYDNARRTLHFFGSYETDA